MRVRLRSTMAGPSGVIQAGEVADLPEELARELIRTKQADAASGAPVVVTERAEDASAEKRETADAPPHRSNRRPRRDT